MSNNQTDKKVTVKRRGDGVYDIYVDDTWVDSRGNFNAAGQRVAELLEENL